MTTSTERRDSLTMIEHLRATERERCAKIAEQVGAIEVKASDEYERGFEDAARQIAFTIRNSQ